MRLKRHGEVTMSLRCLSTERMLSYLNKSRKRPGEDKEITLFSECYKAMHGHAIQRSEYNKD
jgi:hypothetical protein